MYKFFFCCKKTEWYEDECKRKGRLRGRYCNNMSKSCSNYSRFEHKRQSRRAPRSEQGVIWPGTSARFQVDGYIKPSYTLTEGRQTREMLELPCSGVGLRATLDRFYAMGRPGCTYLFFVYNPANLLRSRSMISKPGAMKRMRATRLSRKAHLPLSSVVKGGHES